MDSKSLSHTKWKCQYHIVFIPKYRKKQLYGRLREDVRDVLKTLCEYKKVEIVEGDSLLRSCTFMCMYSTQNECFAVCGISKREKRTYDL